MSRRIWLDETTGGRHRQARHIDIRPGRHFTTVTLNRDAYVYAAQRDGRDGDVELRPGFADAVRRFVDTAVDYLWVHGYPR